MVATVETLQSWETMPCTLDNGPARTVAIGLVTLSNDVVIERELHAFLAPVEGAAVFASRIPLMLELMVRHGSTTVGLYTEEEGGHAFLKWLRSESKFTGAENRLKLADVDWAMMQRWVAEGPTRSPKTKLEIYDGQIPEEMLEDYAPQFTSMLNTMPFENLDHGDIVVTPDHMKEWYQEMEIGGDRLHTVMTREPDGVMSAVTDTLWAPYRPTIIHQMFTGVRPDARGRGLGKWIKAVMLLHLRYLYPDAQWMSTDNAGSNAPMLAINKKVGFRQYRVGSEYQMSRDALAARVRELRLS